MKRTYRNLSYIGAYITLILFSLIGCSDDDSDSPAPGPPSPTIQTLLPDSGQVGSLIRIVGSSFGQDAAKVQVTFNTQVAAIESVSDTLVEVKVPEGAQTGKVRLTVNQDTVYSGQDFRVLISSGATSVSVMAFSPAAGVAGDTLTITGAGFSESPDNVEVKIGEVVAQVIATSATELKVIVPEEAQTGKISVKVGEQAGRSDNDFEVVTVVRITSLSPGSGSVGDTLTITGEGFSTEKDENEVKLGEVIMTIVAASSTELKVIVPKEAKMGKVTVKVGEKEASSEEEFEIVVPVALRITLVSSTDLVEGDTLVIEGEGFGEVLTEIQVKIGDESVEVVEVNETKLSIIIPQGIIGGKVSIEVGDQTVSSEESITVREPSLIITRLDPANGHEGVTVVITGEGFDGDDDKNEVKFNGVKATVTKATPTEITVTVPPGTYTGKVTVTVRGETGTSAEDFKIDWVKKADFPFTGGRYSQHRAFSIDEKGYAIDMRQHKLYRYDPVANNWSEKAEMPNPDNPAYDRRDAVVMVISNKAYAGSGWNINSTTFSDWWEYDPATDKWTRKADCPFNRGVGFAVNGKGYVQRTRTNEVYEYDPVADTWTQKQDFGGEGFWGHSSGFTVQDKGYLVAGNGGSEMWQYDPSGDTWAQKTDFPGKGRSNPTSFVINDKAYVGVGGHGDLWKYDPQTDTWKEQPALPVDANRRNALSFVINSRAYVGNGARPSGINSFYIFSDLWEFTP
ncbi:IPT/TIG domain-containing protein [Tunicatimonas pelagia]|uniref:IPT/TIG domain-containing protein n=1 Tax=Tunicatimonas pelagia TaxID=931531 RepID=UPI002665A44F|nr:IPT/TIG domain-containing protein [Tunicatimonas pelagia]WKN42163.1 IPT/TIG domain-containing protein [Tunicatimonas pelagia]